VRDTFRFTEIHSRFRPPPMPPADAPKNRLLAHAPQCSRCRNPMNDRALLPGRKVDDVACRCEDCGEEVIRAVPRPG
jgi:hypothetical protein